MLESSPKHDYAHGGAKHVVRLAVDKFYSRIMSSFRGNSCIRYIVVDPIKRAPVKIN